ncbi:hypothetical protein BDV93DRAFT_513594 [Ceratobasidium sp. AG-I]|nr:hypothetical protein BDV93DRAFT_513594 [Ceratobasidium sp. AG-I]
MAGPIEKRRVRCLCGCRGVVTTETQKSHMLLKHGKSRTTLRPKLMKLRQSLRRRSIRESIQVHRARSPARASGPSRTETPSPSPSNLPSPSAPNLFSSQELTPIPEIDLSMVWEQVMRLPDPESEFCNRSLTPSEESTSSLETIMEEEEDEEEVEYNPATYGLSPDSLIRERLLVEVAKNGIQIREGQYVGLIPKARNVDIQDRSVAGEGFQREHLRGQVDSLEGGDAECFGVVSGSMREVDRTPRILWAPVTGVGHHLLHPAVFFRAEELDSGDEFSRAWKAETPSLRSGASSSSSISTEITEWFKELLTIMAPLTWWHVNTHRFPRLAATVDPVSADDPRGTLGSPEIRGFGFRMGHRIFRGPQVGAGTFY